MKKYIFFYLLSLASFAQQATVIDTKSITLPRYTSLTTINTALPTPQHGMMVYNIESASNWYYNSSTWVNMATASAEPQGFGSWSCDNLALDAYQPVGNFEGKNNDFFGHSVAISGQYAAIGAHNDDEGTGLINNGSVTILKINNNTGVWEFQGKLVNPNATSNDRFGYALSMSGDYLIVGAFDDDEGVGLSRNGSATIFKRNNSTNAWESQGKLLNLNPATDDFFGTSVAISGDYAIIGAPNDDEGAGLIDNGSASIFKRNTGSGVWEFQSKLLNPNAANDDNFGKSVSISGDYAIVGAPNDDEGIGITDNGSVTIFKRNNSTGIWESQGKLLNFSNNTSDYFGNSVSISGSYAIAGSFYDDETGFTNCGSAIIIKRDSSGTWGRIKKLLNSNTAGNDEFGFSVSISGDYAVVGAPSDSEGVGLSNNGSFTIYRRYGDQWRKVNKSSDPGGQDSDNLGGSCAIDGTNGRFIIGEYKVATNKGLAIFGKVK